PPVAGFGWVTRDATSAGVGAPSAFGTAPGEACIRRRIDVATCCARWRDTPYLRATVERWPGWYLPLENSASSSCRIVCGSPDTAREATSAAFVCGAGVALACCAGVRALNFGFPVMVRSPARTSFSTCAADGGRDSGLTRLFLTGPGAC